MNFCTRSRSCIALATSLLSIAALPFVLASILAAQSSDSATHAEAQARQAWRETMHHTDTYDTGCFHASYPSTQWEKVECGGIPAYRSSLRSGLRSGLGSSLGSGLRKLTGNARTETVAGNWYDYVAQAPSGSLLSSALGSFPSVTGVTKEATVNVEFNGGYSDGLTGPNEYTLQVNTNFANTAACDGYTYCYAWQQYVVSTGGPTEVFIEYWLINYGVHDGDKDICPAGFIDIGQSFLFGDEGDMCVQNTPSTVVYEKGPIPITDLASLQLSGSAQANGTDRATATYDGDAYAATVKDSWTDIATAWTQAEFNVLGDGGGARADFNQGTAVTVNIALTDGSTNTPICVPPTKEEGTTGETNNLTPRKGCTATGGSTPSIEFLESN
jgi:hypothetical protein